MVINGAKGVIQILDSKGTVTRRPQVQQLLQGLQNRIKRLADLHLIGKHRWRDTQVKEWRLIECVNEKIQIDNSSCGLFTLKFMELWTGNKLSSMITQKDMTNFRLKLAVTLVNYPWNKVKGSPGWKYSDVEENYTPEENEKKK
ncbi:unnamed protein product [Urochloa decumbens]|uniref:Ubiquitin-like protease family profile domain-containing protein n=1 Tax=Urochloa decumbens TaxID=240449 RepID=A0ABC8WKZ7_9POAL